ncbi:hypothetical protein [Micromonospora sp. NPDC023633]
MTDPTHALSFGAAARDHARFRPRRPEAAGRERFELPYRTLVCRARRR